MNHSPHHPDIGFADTIVIHLGEQALPVRAGTTLATLLHTQGQASDGVATAINGVFVARGQRADRSLADGDVVVLFRPIVGG